MAVVTCSDTQRDQLQNNINLILVQLQHVHRVSVIVWSARTHDVVTSAFLSVHRRSKLCHSKTQPLPIDKSSLHQQSTLLNHHVPKRSCPTGSPLFHHTPLLKVCRRRWKGCSKEGRSNRLGRSC